RGRRRGGAAGRASARRASRARRGGGRRRCRAPRPRQPVEASNLAFSFWKSALVFANWVSFSPSTATKYIQPSFVGLSAAAKASSPGFPIGPGGRPLLV